MNNSAPAFAPLKYNEDGIPLEIFISMDEMKNLLAEPQTANFFMSKFPIINSRVAELKRLFPNKYHYTVTWIVFNVFSFVSLLVSGYFYLSVPVSPAVFYTVSVGFPLLQLLILIASRLFFVLIHRYKLRSAHRTFKKEIANVVLKLKSQARVSGYTWHINNSREDDIQLGNIKFKYHKPSIFNVYIKPDGYNKKKGGSVDAMNVEVYEHQIISEARTKGEADLFV